MNKRLLLFIHFVIPVALMFFCSLDVQASRGVIDEMPFSVDGVSFSEDASIRTIDLSYTNNTYVCVDDMSWALGGSRASFEVSLDGTEVNITLGRNVQKEEQGEETQTSDENNSFNTTSCSLSRPDFYVDDEKRYYYVIEVDTDEDGAKEVYMTPYDLAMLLDINIDVNEDDSIVIDTNKSFEVDPVELETEGFFQGVNGIVVGNASTGDIFYSYQADTAYPIASTTKLMTYLLTREHMSEVGDSLDTYVTLSKEAEILSGSDDGVVPMITGTQVTIRELMQAMLIPSSNEAALSLAEYSAGSEQAFVPLMNEKAGKLDMNTAIYYNCSGLPIYTDGTYAAKKQNRMSAMDMFTLASYILGTYPEITEITDTQKLTLGVLKKEIDNTNAVIYNLPEATGLKTGTTTKSGACLVTSLKLGEGETAQDIVIVVLGAETNADRGRVSELLARYASAVWRGEARAYGSGDLAGINERPTTAEGFVSLITRMARGKQ